MTDQVEQDGPTPEPVAGFGVAQLPQLGAAGLATAPPVIRQTYYVLIDPDDGNRVLSTGHVDAGIRDHVLALPGHVEISEELFRRLDFTSSAFRLEDGQLSVILPPPPSDQELDLAARARRDQLLAQSDWMVQPDVPGSDEVKAARLAYRQALRDVPQQEGFPRKVVWPTI